PSRELDELWARRNEYEPVATILKSASSLLDPTAPVWDYQKYRGPLWQVHFLGELWADGNDPRATELAEHAFSRQLDDGAWSVSGKPAGAIPCLTANVGRALARTGWARDERVVRALARVAADARDAGHLACGRREAYTLNGYCHMLAPKLLLFLSEVPRELWPDGAEAMRDECVRVLRAREIFRCLPEGSRAYLDVAGKHRPAELPTVRQQWLAEHGPLVYTEKPGWLKFGFPLSYNSDALESLAALAAVGEPMRPEYEPALALVRDGADSELRWVLRNSFNGKMLADVEKKGQPSKWLTLRALLVLRHFDGERLTAAPG
ncbi:MAG: hypothetical protein P4L93_10295, partial [Coriobacteriia bacterium]|nr:hypothetical protein [Coriobacteriia bacterium]